MAPSLPPSPKGELRSFITRSNCLRVSSFQEVGTVYNLLLSSIIVKVQKSKVKIENPSWYHYPWFCLQDLYNPPADLYQMPG